MGMLLSKYGECSFAENGKIACDIFKADFNNGLKFDLMMLDIMMPEMDGQETLKHIREFEKENGIWPSEGTRVIMTTALGDPENIKEAFRSQCEGYLVKPIIKKDLLDEMIKIGLL